MGDHLYIPDKDSNKKPLPSPKDLKNKILLRGKKLDSDVDEEEEEEEVYESERKRDIIIISDRNN